MIKDNFILKINTKNLIKNYKYFQKKKKNLIVAPTIKANSYGLGDLKIFNLLYAHGCKHFFVATLEEGLELRKLKKNIVIYILNGIQNHNNSIFLKNKLTPIINTNIELKKIIKTKIKFGLHIDTGINRLGIDYRNIPNFIYDNKNINILISHLASADESNNNYNLIQRKRFISVINKFKNKNIINSLSNSNGSELSKMYLFDMIRPGIALYGGNNGSKSLRKNIRPVVELKGKILQIKKLKKEDFVGYNQTFKTNKETTIAIISTGYADGIPRKLSNKGIVYYKNEKFRIIGRISMDSITIDISKSKYNIKEGMYIDFINYTYGIESFAKQCHTISNEIITSIGQRVKRFYD